MKNKILNSNNSLNFNQRRDSTIITIDNSQVLDIYGINNENLKLFEKDLSIKVYQKGNQLSLVGDIKKINILVNAIKNTINENKLSTKNKNSNIMLENLKMEMLRNNKNIKNINITRTEKLDVVGKSKMQNSYLEILRSKQIIFAVGPAGTGKTFLAVAAAVSQLLEKSFDRIILSRPAVEAGEKLGFLPGDIKEKVDPYLRPLYDALYDLISSDLALKKIETSEIEIAPLAFMRGRTLNNSFVILDEAQNATHNQIKMFLTRCGKNSRMVVIGDPSQTDLNRRADSGLLRSIQILRDIEEVAVINFDHKDIVRDKMVTKIINAYDSHDDQIKDLFDKKS